LNFKGVNGNCTAVTQIMTEQIEKVMKALRKNNIEPFYVDDKQQVCAVVEKLLKEGDSVSCGGSLSLAQSGVSKMLSSGKYVFLDRSKATSNEEMQNIYRQTFGVDAYFCSSNAITENGELYNVDGNSNRVAAILFGPKIVIMVVGVNKIVANIDEAQLRVKTIAAPLNAKRLNCKTYCCEKGHCVALDTENPEIPSGCASDARICCNYVISARQRIKNRIKVILVGESLGF